MDNFLTVFRSLVTIAQHDDKVHASARAYAMAATEERRQIGRKYGKIESRFERGTFGETIDRYAPGQYTGDFGENFGTDLMREVINDEYRDARREEVRSYRHLARKETVASALQYYHDNPEALDAVEADLREHCTTHVNARYYAKFMDALFVSLRAGVNGEPRPDTLHTAEYSIPMPAGSK